MFTLIILINNKHSIYAKKNLKFKYIYIYKSKHVNFEISIF